MAWPTAGFFTSGITNLQAKTNQDSWLAQTRKLFGAGGATGTLTIAAGVIVPTGADRAFIDTEAAAAADNLDTIDLTNIEDGGVLVISPISNARVPTVRHAQGGTGQIFLNDSTDFALSSTTMSLLLRRNGAAMYEEARNLGANMYAGLNKYGYAKGAQDSVVQTGADDTTYVSPLKLANWFTNILTVARSVSGIWTFTKGRAKSQVLVDGATVNWNAANGSIATLTAAGSRTIAAPTNLTADMFYFFRHINDATGGRVPTWNAVFKWAGGAAPSGTTTANALDEYTFYSPDGTNLHEVGHRFDVR